MKTVKLLDTSGRNEINALVLDNNDSNNNKSTYKPAHRKYYLKNREKLLDRAHQRYAENPMYWREYYERTKKNNKS